jgi:hypothetical protein
MSQRIEYAEYLKTDEWKAQRRSALVFARNRCQVCNGRKRLEVHHRTYERLGNEDPSDLTVLCSTCHKLFHDRLPKPPLKIRRTPQPKSIAERDRSIHRLKQRLGELQQEIVATASEEGKFELLRVKLDVARELEAIETDPELREALPDEERSWPTT